MLKSEYRGLLLLIRRRARDPQLAADLLNEALVVALTKYQAGQIADLSRICGYVFQVAMNLLRNHRRSFGEDSNRRGALSETSLATESLPEDAQNDWAERVRRLIEELPSSRDRAMIKRFYLDEEEKESICSEMKLSSLQFDKIVFRAKKRLLSLFESRGLRKGDFFSVLLSGVALA